MSLAEAVAGPGISADVFVLALAVLYWLPYHRRAGRLAREGRAGPALARSAATPAASSS